MNGMSVIVEVAGAVSASGAGVAALVAVLAAGAGSVLRFSQMNPSTGSHVSKGGMVPVREVVAQGTLIEIKLGALAQGGGQKVQLTWIVGGEPKTQVILIPANSNSLTVDVPANATSVQAVAVNGELQRWGNAVNTPLGG